MEISELDNLVEIITRKIYHENIIFYEEAALKDEFLENMVISLEESFIKKIYESIKNNKDLNQLGINKNGIKCIISDLNEYLDKVKISRLTSIDSWIKLINESDDLKDLLNYIRVFLDTHTEKENSIIKRVVLKKINYPLFERLDYKQIDSIFYEVMINFEMEIEQKR